MIWARGRGISVMGVWELEFEVGLERALRRCAALSGWDARSVRLIKGHRTRTVGDGSRMKESWGSIFWMKMIVFSDVSSGG